MGKLTDRSVRTLAEGRYDDGDGLRLIVSASGKRSWILRFQMSGRRRDMGLGAYPEIGLKDAREAAFAARSLAARGVDPIDAREAARKSSRRIPTFKEIAAQEIADAQERSSNAKVRYQAQRHLGPAYCQPFLDRPVNEITTTEIAVHLRPIWKKKPEVARKLYPAIRRVFDRARVVLKADHGVVMVDNPANWANLKAQGFEKPKELTRGHHPSLPHVKMPAFMAAVRGREAMAARLLEFVILTNVRTDAARRAEWSEFDMNSKTWTIPMDRMKDRKHRKDEDGFRVPLSERAVAILEELSKARLGDIVFAASATKPLSSMAMLALLARMNAQDEGFWKDANGRPIVVHGFRATFRTWAEEISSFPHTIVEEAMGHAVGTRVERAYRRSDVLERRRSLMSAWASYCEPDSSAKIVVLAKSRGSTF